MAKEEKEECANCGVFYSIHRDTCTSCGMHRGEDPDEFVRWQDEQEMLLEDDDN